MSEVIQDARNFIVADDDDGIRLDRWFRRHLPDANFNIVSRWARIDDNTYRAEIRSAELPQVNATTVYRRVN
jgi:hypothetical protein